MSELSCSHRFQPWTFTLPCAKTQVPCQRLISSTEFRRCPSWLEKTGRSSDVAPHGWNYLELLAKHVQTWWRNTNLWLKAISRLFALRSSVDAAKGMLFRGRRHAFGSLVARVPLTPPKLYKHSGLFVKNMGMHTALQMFLFRCHLLLSQQREPQQQQIYKEMAIAHTKKAGQL